MYYKNKRIKRMHKRNKTGAYTLHAVRARRFACLAVIIFFITVIFVQDKQNIQNVSRETLPEAETIVLVKEAITAKPYTSLQAHVTGYNTVPEQTDATPCISATGDNICGRSDVIACPRSLKLGTEVEIEGKRYTCLDRTSHKYDGRFDISCDKDMACPYEVTGYKTVKIYE